MSDHEEINVRLATIETKLDLVLDEHRNRIEKLESAQGKQNAVYLLMSALGISIGFAVKYVMFGGKT